MLSIQSTVHIKSAMRQGIINESVNFKQVTGLYGNYRLGIYRQLTTKRCLYLLARLVSVERPFMNISHDWLECRGTLQIILHINMSFISS